jgi:hypothetical protein
MRMLNRIAIGSVLLSMLLFSSCSLVCLGMASVISPNDNPDDETTGKMADFDVSAESVATGTKISWDEYITEPKGENVFVAEDYDIYRTDTNPWDDFRLVKTVHDPYNLKPSPERLSWIDPETPGKGNRFYYRVSCVYTESTSDGTDKYKVLSEVVEVVSR